MGAADITVLNVMRNDDLPITITFLTSQGDIVNITNSTIYFTVKVANTDADSAALISKSWTSHLDPANGVTSFALIPSDTTSMLGKYYFDIQIKLENGYVYTPLHGLFNVVADTRLSAS